MINDHRRFLYKGGVETGRIFEKDEKIPTGWFDRPNHTEWDNPPVQPEKPKYLSQMNKEELREIADGLSLKLDDSATKKQMISEITQKMKEDNENE